MIQYFLSSEATMAKGLNITYKPLDEDHVWATMTWSEQDVGGGHLTVEVVVRNMKAAPKSPEQLESDAKALAIRFVRAFADIMEDGGA